MNPVVVGVQGVAPYEVVVGRGVRDRVSDYIPADSNKVAIIHPPTLRVTAQNLRTDLLDGRDVITIEVPDGERAKTVEVAAYCWSVLGQAGFTRQDAVIGLGGGATTDVAGFVAATWLRGVPLIHVSTTLLGMVDAAVGGKTGINTAEGKNLVGAFYEPIVVLADTELVANMPPVDYVAGLAEVIKCGFIADPEILDIIEADPADAADPAGNAQTELIRRAVAVKAAVVSEDFRERANFADARSIGREVLNYGHTFGHAIERVESYEWRHGAAISVGMVYVAELARLANRLPAEVVDRHRSILSSVGLPTEYSGADWADLLAAMKVDKKSRGSLLRFIVLDQIGKPAVLAGPDPAMLVAAYGEISG